MGAEWNFPNPEDKSQAYRIRAGFGVLPSPYSNRVTGIDPILKKANTVLACGFGFRDKDYYVDFALSSQSASGYYTPYAVGDPRFYSDNQDITYKRSRVFLTFTLGLNLDWGGADGGDVIQTTTNRFISPLKKGSHSASLFYLLKVISQFDIQFQASAETKFNDFLNGW